jgi:hypothetical protein
MTLSVPLMHGNAPAAERFWIQQSLPTEPVATIRISADSAKFTNCRIQKGKSANGFPFLFDMNRSEGLLNLSVSGEHEALQQFIHEVYR